MIPNIMPLTLPVEAVLFVPIAKQALQESHETAFYWLLPAGLCTIHKAQIISNWFLEHETRVITVVGPGFSMGELHGHLAYDLNPSVNQPVGLRRSLASTSSSGSKRHKSGSMEDEVDSPGEYYHSPSPASSSRNWTEDVEGGLSPPVKKTEVDSPPQKDSPRLGSFTQPHRPVIAVHSGLSRSPHPSPSLYFPSAPYFPHGAIRYPPHLAQDPLKDLVSLASDPVDKPPSSLNGSNHVKVSSHYISSQLLVPPGPTPSLAPPPPSLHRPTLPAESKATTTTSSERGTNSPTSPTCSTPGTPPSNCPTFIGVTPQDAGELYQAQKQFFLSATASIRLGLVVHVKKHHTHHQFALHPQCNLVLSVAQSFSFLRSGVLVGPDDLNQVSTSWILKARDLCFFPGGGSPGWTSTFAL
ncbi:Nuclear factor 1 C-type [Takifugu flavidus]|uniref:Nuclear factor 1 C-type n=1 Tax=Takifugu flavidus TaxID=433684 RepID=A0A5C6MQJ9_9TELE|nr:Nuclear factor 1 C-type [Takifugu flavidus]